MSMQNSDLYFSALSAISQSPLPVGAWYLRRILLEKDVDVSEATCGRLLRNMEDSGHVQSEGRRGRTITLEGEVALAHWQEEKVRERSQAAFMQSLEINGPKQLKDVLVARRAIEAEAAALAAVNARERDLERLKGLIDEHRKVLASGESGTDQNTAFHRAIAVAGRNDVIVTALDVIYRHPDVMKAFEHIRAKVGSRMVDDHSLILEKVLSRDPEAARESMVQHMANVIRDVDTYWKEWVKPDEGSKPGS